MVKVNFAARATGTADGKGVNNRFGTEPGLMVMAAVAEIVGVGDGVGVWVAVGVELGLLVFVGEMTAIAVGVNGLLTTAGGGALDMLTAITMVRINMPVPASSQRRARLRASSRMK